MEELKYADFQKAMDILLTRWPDCFKEQTTVKDIPKILLKLGIITECPDDISLTSLVHLIIETQEK